VASRPTPGPIIYSGSIGSHRCFVVFTTSGPPHPKKANPKEPIPPIGATHLSQSVPPTFLNRCHPPIDATPSIRVLLFNVRNLPIERRSQPKFVIFMNLAIFQSVPPTFLIGATHRFRRGIPTYRGSFFRLFMGVDSEDVLRRWGIISLVRQHLFADPSMALEWVAIVLATRLN
jgi:hypothetical protein